ncbi:hypothetical protein AD998_04475 [bacterium 336/3]|nr:hypothetical protein AD998_04475 [bacterium 336/3]
MKRNIIGTTIILFVITLTTISMNAPKFIENNKTEKMLQTECNYSFHTKQGFGFKGCKALVTSIHAITPAKRGKYDLKKTGKYEGPMDKIDKNGQINPSSTYIYIYKSREAAEEGREKVIKEFTRQSCKIIYKEVKDKCK